MLNDIDVQRTMKDKLGVAKAPKPRPRRTAPDRTGSQGEDLSLRQRAWPLLEMMKAAHSAAGEIVWGV